MTLKDKVLTAAKTFAENHPSAMLSITIFLPLIISIFIEEAIR